MMFLSNNCRHCLSLEQLSKLDAAVLRGTLCLIACEHFEGARGVRYLIVRIGGRFLRANVVNRIDCRVAELAGLDSVL